MESEKKARVDTAIRVPGLLVSVENRHHVPTGIRDNVLSFLDLNDLDNVRQSSHELHGAVEGPVRDKVFEIMSQCYIDYSECNAYDAQHPLHACKCKECMLLGGCIRQFSFCPKQELKTCLGTCAWVLDMIRGNCLPLQRDKRVIWECHTQALLGWVRAKPLSERFRLVSRPDIVVSPSRNWAHCVKLLRLPTKIQHSGTLWKVENECVVPFFEGGGNHPDLN